MAGFRGGQRPRERFAEYRQFARMAADRPQGIRQRRGFEADHARRGAERRQDDGSMHLIVVRKGRGPRRIAVGRHHLGVLAGATLAAAAAIAVGGYLLGRGAHGASAGKVATLRARLAHESSVLQDLRVQSRAGVDAIAARMAKLDAQVSQLDAMGAEVVRLAGLKQSGFDFNSTPGEGGPQPAAEIPWSRPQLDLATSALSSRVWGEQRKLSALEALLVQTKLSAEIIPRGKPLTDGWVSSGWGWRTDPITGEREFHEGLDFAGHMGDTVHAIAAGVVTWAGPRYGYGKLIIINDGDGYSTYYAHNEKVLVSVGQVVRRGDAVALLGETGHATGPHVHLEVHLDGKPVDPSAYVYARGGNG